MVVQIKNRMGVPNGWQTLHPLDAPFFAKTPTPKKIN